MAGPASGPLLAAAFTAAPPVADFNRADTDELLQMWQQSFAFGVGTPGLQPAADPARYLVEEMLAKTRIQVVKHEGRLIAFVAAHPRYLAQLHVRVEFIGQGLGAALLRLAKAQSTGALALHALTRNARACRFYEAHGFRAVAHGFEPLWQLDEVEYRWVGAAGRAAQ